MSAGQCRDIFPVVAYGLHAGLEDESSGTVDFLSVRSDRVVFEITDSLRIQQKSRVESEFLRDVRVSKVSRTS
jgi:hypothetical protein